MRFRRRPRVPYVVTDRKRAAAARAQLRQRDALPLLADIIADQQPPIDQLMEDRIVASAQAEQQWRDWRARSWRRARQKLDTYEAAARVILLRYWNEHRWLPGDPSYLLDTLHSFDTGRLVIEGNTLTPGRPTLPTRDALAGEAVRKPIASGWLGWRR